MSWGTSGVCVCVWVYVSVSMDGPVSGFEFVSVFVPTSMSAYLSVILLECVCADIVYMVMLAAHQTRIATIDNHTPKYLAVLSRKRSMFYKQQFSAMV